MTAPKLPACFSPEAVVNLVSSDGPGGSPPGTGALAGRLHDLVSLVSLICENAYSGTIVCDKDSRILYMNRFYADLLGIDREEAVGRHIRDFFPSSRVPIVLQTGRGELGAKCTLRAEVDYVVNRIPVKRDGETIGVILQTAFKNYTEINELMKRLKTLEARVVQYKKGLDSMLSATYTFDSIIGNGNELREAKRLAEKYAQTDGSVLILGATGTGKELFAHAIHLASRRKNGPFVCLNCAAIPRDLLESELFGYEKGAFTGAQDRGKAGRIELAHRGTLFLDEIGDIPLNAQAKILRLLEARQVERLGGVKTVHVDFRLIAATNRNLTEMIAKGTFREDLYYRMNTMTVGLPLLSERKEDIPVLIRHFLNGMGKPQVSVTDAASGALMTYGWPGNIRELKNVVERATSLLENDLLDVDHLPEILKEGTPCRGKGPAGEIKPLAKELASHERELLLQALSATKQNMSKTARLLKISRSTLYEKCRLHGL